MSFFFPKTDRLVAAGLLLSLAASGCASHPETPATSPLQSPVASAKDPPTKGLQRCSPAMRAAASGSAATVKPGPQSPRDIVLHADWVIVAVPSDAAASESIAATPQPGPATAKPVAPIVYRWHHPGLDELVARPAATRPDLHTLLVDSDPAVSAGAAIMLARSGDDKMTPKLLAAVNSADLKVSARAAAVETLSASSAAGLVDTLGRLADQYGNFATAGKSYLPDLHAELIRGLARHEDPADDPRIRSALRSPSSVVRIETLGALAKGRRGELPVEAANLRNDGDPRVRTAALAAIAARKFADAPQILADALHDADLQVRVSAIAAMGTLDDPQIRATLTELLKDRSEVLRAEAVAALARQGSKPDVLRAATDSSWRVRIKVAQILAGYADREGAAVARRLLDDPSAEVQRQTVGALAAWPLELAGPILLEAMGKTALMTRRAATEQFTARWTPAAEFPFASQPKHREEVLQRLQTQFRGQFDTADAKALRWTGFETSSTIAGTMPAGTTSASASAPRNKTPATASAGRQIDPVTVECVERLVKAEDRKALAAFGPGLVESMEHIAVDRGRVLPESVYHDVLPRYRPAFAALDRLHSPDVLQRRSAAEELATLAPKQPLGRLAAARLVDLVTPETDALVFQSALMALADDPSEPAVRLARVALGHDSAEVRRRGCEYLAAHPSPDHAKFLLPRLEDSNHTVAVAAIRATAAADRIDNLEPLKKLQASADEEIRLESAVGLSRLHDATGPAALERLSYGGDPKIRTRVAQAMGELGDAVFTATLIRLLDDSRGSVSHAALAGLPGVVGRDVAQRVLGGATRTDASNADTSQQIRLWKQWYSDHGAVSRR